MKFDMIEFIQELEGMLKSMENEIEYTVDRFEGDFAVCENRVTRQIINIDKNELPEGVEEGTFIKYKDGKYILDEEKQKIIEKRISEKMNDLWD